MFNLIKFEMLKHKKMFSILGVLFLLMQVFIIYKTSILTTTDNDLIDKGGLLVFISYIGFIYSSILTFSKDINSTDRSVVFMTPNSGFKIVSSKFLTTIISGTALVLTTFIWFIANAYYVDPRIKFEIIEYLKNGELLLTTHILILIFLSIGSFFALVFLSIIITKTFLSKLKFKTLIIIIVMSILSKFFNFVFWDNFEGTITTTMGMSIVAMTFITTLMLWISGWLIDNKTDF
ncbi:hypothetical protein NRK67_05730 [Fusobacteria bacterium ZRK30]|nr:hypothetical protein NRK67_05730 [Fusobacteria bacterium ZRK30]